MTPTRTIPDVLSQHGEEAAFLWVLRDRALSLPNFTRARLADFDGRLEAHVDGLRLHGEDGWEYCRQALEQFSGAGEVFAAAVLALEGRKPDRLEPILALTARKPGLGRAVASAFGWIEGIAQDRVIGLLASTSPAIRRIAIAATAVRRDASATVLQAALDDPDPGVKARALRAVGELGAGTYAAMLRKNFSHADPACRFWACWSAARLGDKPAAAELQMLAQAETFRRGTAANLAVRVLDLAVVARWLEMLAQLPGGARLSLQGAGWLGEPAAVPRLLEAMKTPELARVAGEAFTFITGVDLDVQKLTAPRPEGFEAGPNEDPADENVEMDPDANLPWPDAGNLAAWWQKNRAAFPAGRRLLLGKPITPEWLREVLRVGRQRQRAAAALELAVREPNKPLVNVRAPGFRQ